MVLSKDENKLSKPSVKRQLSNAPGPNDKCRSGYPHVYQNKDRNEAGEPLFRARTESSTTSYREFPVLADDRDYNYDSKPKDRPGPFRAITNQNKTFKGVICHDGEKGNVAGGGFHRAKDEEEDEDERKVEDEDDDR
jgi:hypothetical protein